MCVSGRVRSAVVGRDGQGHLGKGPGSATGEGTVRIRRPSHHLLGWKRTGRREDWLHRLAMTGLAVDPAHDSP